MKIKSLEKTIKYRLSYSGTKETDILYNKFFLKNFSNFDKKDLLLIENLFKNFSDNEIYFFLTKKIEVPKKYKSLFNKVLNEK